MKALVIVALSIATLAPIPTWAKQPQETGPGDAAEEGDRKPKAFPFQGPMAARSSHPEVLSPSMMTYPHPSFHHQQPSYVHPYSSYYPFNPTSYYHNYYYPTEMPAVRKPQFTYYSYGIKGVPKYFDADKVHQDQLEEVSSPFHQNLFTHGLPMSTDKSGEMPTSRDHMGPTESTSHHLGGQELSGETSGRTSKVGSMMVNSLANLYGPPSNSNLRSNVPSNAFNKRMLRRKTSREAMILHQTRTQSAVMAEQYLSQFESKDSCFHQSFCQASIADPNEVDTTKDEQDAADEAIRVLKRMLSLVGEPSDRFPHVRQLIAAHNVGKETRNPTLCKWLFPCQAIKDPSVQARMTCKQSARLCPGISISCGLCAIVSPESCSVICPVAGIYCGAAGYSCAIEAAMAEKPMKSDPAQEEAAAGADEAGAGERATEEEGNAPTLDGSSN